MPFLNWDDFEDCVQSMQDQGYDEESANKICGSLESEYEEQGEESAEALKDKILNDAESVLNDLKLKLVSVVDNPAQPSDWVMMKSEEGDYDWKTQSPILKLSEHTCECLECGNIIETEKHCSNLECPECGGEMRREERPGDGKPDEKEDGEEKRIAYAPTMVPGVVDKQGDAYLAMSSRVRLTTS